MRYHIEKEGNILVLKDENGDYYRHYKEESYVVLTGGVSYTLKANYEHGFWIMEEYATEDRS